MSKPAAAPTPLELALLQAEAHGRSPALAQGIQALMVRLEGLGQRNLQHPRTHGELKARLLQDIRSQRPFSLLRLGDGEGNVLFWDARREQYPELAAIGMERILRLMFGRHGPARAQWTTFGEPIVQAVRHATYVGLPTPTQIQDCAEAMRAAAQPGFDVRGRTGVVGVWDWLIHEDPAHPGGDWLADPERVIVNWHVHLSLLGCAKEMVAAAGNVSAVTCYPDVLGRLAAACGVAEGRSYLIPPQAGNISATPKEAHYPGIFQQLCAQLAADTRPGDLVFVGAGLLGKAYCEVVRAAGGMAVDVGSMMDVWMGHGVRVYQNAEFVAKHKL